MKQAYYRIPVFAGDVSGVCAALYELGGMTIVHDPSGCNSTYNTHDETRWYDQDSLIFTSGLTERQAILGNDQKLLRDVTAAARELSPSFIALVGSPIPFLSGTDFPALARLVERDTGIPAFFVPSNGMHDYAVGAGQALAEIARRFVPEPEQVRPRGVNLLGITPLDFATKGSAEALRKTIRQGGWEILSCWAMWDSLEDLARAGQARVNLVVSSAGLAAARVLQERFGTPYVVGAPVGGFAEPLLAEMEQAAASMESSVPYLSRSGGKTAVTLIGEPVTMGSLAAAIAQTHGLTARVLCPLETWEGLLGPSDLALSGEEDLAQALADTEIVIADPLYRPLCPKGCKFFALPHQAFSGRCFHKTMPNLFELEMESYGTE